jgi:membrane-bound metal-dependent hydrolase YbcI (DUF457 family)
MPLPIAHGLVGASIVSLVHPNADLKKWQPLLFGFVLANTPDLDFVFTFVFGWHGFHRGFTHSLVFAALIAAVFFALLHKRNWQIPLAYSAAFLSHTILDFISAKSGGIRLLIPFDYNSYRLGLISFSELTRGFLILDMLYFSLIETLMYVPLFVFTLFIREKKNQFENKI